jgi:hypothetical protein
MKFLKYLILSSAALTLSSVVAVADTWICDSKASAGFDKKRGYEVITYSASRSYRVEANISRSSLSLEGDQNNSIFEKENEFLTPASIQLLGDDFVGLCRKVSVAPTEFISCNGILNFGTNFHFDLNTGLFSMLAGGFENGGASWVEVGECRRIN